jgi:hypothetical protein
MIEKVQLALQAAGHVKRLLYNALIVCKVHRHEHMVE